MVKSEWTKVTSFNSPFEEESIKCLWKQVRLVLQVPYSQKLGFVNELRNFNTRLATTFQFKFFWYELIRSREKEFLVLRGIGPESEHFLSQVLDSILSAKNWITHELNILSLEDGTDYLQVERVYLNVVEYIANLLLVELSHERARTEDMLKRICVHVAAEKLDAYHWIHLET